MKIDLLAKTIIKSVGGAENVKNVLHCATRLRFEVISDKEVNIDSLNEIEEIQGVVKRTNQYQVVLGQGFVEKVYAEVRKIVDKNSNSNEVVKEPQKFSFKGLFDNFLDAMSSIFAPIIPAIVGSGMIMGILYSLSLLGWIDNENHLVQILNVFSNAAFYFLPMYLAFSSAQRFKANPYVASLIGAILIHPTFINMINEGNTVLEIGFIKIVLQNYSSSVVPIILSIYFMSFVEKGLKKIVPQMIDIIVTPTLTVIITGIVALWVLGPIGQFVGLRIADVLLAIHGKFSWAAGFIYGLTYPFILATGMQVGFSPITVMNLETLGYDFLYPFSAASNAAMAAAALFILVKTRDKKLKSVAGSTGVSALIGITEPVLFGLVLKFKKVLFAVMAGGAIGGTIMGIFKVQYAGFGFVPFGTLMLAFGPTFIYYMIGVVASMATTVIVLSFTGFDTKKILLETICSPVSGTVTPLMDVKDDSFANGYVGEGIAVEPTEDVIYAPCSGLVIATFDTNHAFGIRSNEGVEVLVHIGIDLTQMDNIPISSDIQKGSKIKQGDILARIDRASIKQQGYEPTVITVITNSEDYSINIIDTIGNVDKNSKLIEVNKKER